MNATGIWRECMKSSSETASDFHRDMYGLGCGEDAEKSFEEQRVAERSGLLE
jgi:hypothetical protein